MTNLLETITSIDENAPPEPEDEYWNPQEPDPEPEPEERKSKYVIRDAAYALQERPPREYIVEGLLEPQTVNTFFGEAGSGKTYSLLHMGVSVAMNLPWLNFQTKQCNVLFVNEETHEGELAERLGRVLRGLNADGTTPFYSISLEQVKADNKKSLIELYWTIKELNAGLVIIDALTEIMDGDENSKKDLQPVYSNLQRMAGSTGATFVIIHHPNKNNGTYRGSSVIKGSSNLLVKVTGSDDGSITYSTEKNRNGKPLKWAAQAEWHEGRFTLERTHVTESAKAFNKAETYVIRFLEKNGISSVSTIKNHADTCSGNAARQAVYSLTSKGILYRTDKGTQGESAYYDLTAEYKPSEH